jgi:dihydroneopterin aldolase / 2-amino-4-hydroxy-6-hydroxymethyldihydropteridine diphosphokinase
MDEQVVIGLGSNIGHPSRTLVSAFKDLASLSTDRLVASRIFRTAAWGLAEGAADFANAVVSFECRLEPIVLLNRLQSIEVMYGRPAADQRLARDGSKMSEREPAHYESRVLDLDIVAFGSRLIDEADLKVPHPRAFERLFVLVPLQEIEPGFRFANRQDSLQQLIDKAPEMQLEPWQN